MKNSRMQKFKYIIMNLLFILIIPVSQLHSQSKLTYPIVDTGQKNFYDNTDEISAPAIDAAFWWEDAQYSGNQPSYADNGDGTITDNVTGLMWQKSPDMNSDGIINYDDKLTYNEALTAADTFSLAGYSDWRLPSIKELYSLIMFYGLDPSGYTGNDTAGLVPFINTKNFDFNYGDVNAGERIIDAQFATSTLYSGKTMGGNPIMFGVNFADGRIKGYPYEKTSGPQGIKKFYVLFVRGNTDYGKNNFAKNNDGTITDLATGLMWAKYDSKVGLNWEEALKWVQQMNSGNYLGHNNWRLPDVKELQSIVDYSRSLQATNSAAIDTIFSCSEMTDEGGSTDYPFYWSSTTHANMMHGSNAAYVAFGEALGWMQDPMSGEYQIMDVHGAGAQRSDPKSGNPADYPYGHGPQGDVIRIYNYVRLVRDTDVKTSVGNADESTLPKGFKLSQNYPNPFNPTTTIEYSIPEVVDANFASATNVELKVYDLTGKEVAALVNKKQQAGSYKVSFNAGNLACGIYFYRLIVGTFNTTKKMVLLK